MVKYTTIESAALSFARISGLLRTAKAIGKEKMYTDFVKAVLKDLASRSDNCDFGLLWNALTEKGEKEMLMSVTHPDNPVVIHADSGGLQEITLGLTITDQDKLDIYDRQGRYSTHAMSFDKMPIVVDREAPGANSDILDLSNRYFVKELLYDVGRESGFNVLEQCRVIANLPEEERKSKVLIIIQGSTFEDYLKYAKGLFSVFEELDEKERSKLYESIGGLSMGMSGVTNYFDLMDLYCRGPVEFTMVPERIRNNIHFLGIGGITKVGPLMAIQDNFYGDNRDVHFTFDSTSRTSASTYGRYTEIEITEKGPKKISEGIGRNLNPISKLHIDRMYNEYKELIETYLDRDVSTIDKFRNHFTPYRDDGIRKMTDLKKAYSEQEALEIYLGIVGVSDFLHWCVELISFYKVLDLYSNGDYSLISRTPLRKAVERLHSIETYEEYMLPKNREYFKLLLSKLRIGNINILETMEDLKFIQNSGIDEDEW